MIRGEAGSATDRFVTSILGFQEVLEKSHLAGGHGVEVIFLGGVCEMSIEILHQGFPDHSG